MVAVLVVALCCSVVILAIVVRRDSLVVDITGNEKVDKNAKESLNLEVTDFKIPFNNF